MAAASGEVLYGEQKAREAQRWSESVSRACDSEDEVSEMEVCKQRMPLRWLGAPMRLARFGLSANL